MKSASFLIFEQKFLEHLSEGKYMEALKTLRNDIAPLLGRVHELSTIISSPTATMSLGSEPRLRLIEKLQNLLPAAIMVPERSLEVLLEQALDRQRMNCLLHNTIDMEMLLLTDHQCGSSQIRSRTLQVKNDNQVVLKHKLKGHQKPVFTISWSPDDRQLLTCGLEEVIRRWDANSGEC